MNPFTYVYILRSETDPNHFYVGRTKDLRARIRRHNSGQVPHTSKWKPWEIKTYMAFSDAVRAVAFERYLKISFRQSLHQATTVGISKEIEEHLGMRTPFDWWGALRARVTIRQLPDHSPEHRAAMIIP